MNKPSPVDPSEDGRRARLPFEALEVISPSDEPKTASKQRIGGIVHRMRSALSRSTSNRAMAGASSPSDAEASKSAEQTLAVQEPTIAPATPPTESMEKPAEKGEYQLHYKASRQTLFEERARALFAKYELVLEPDWVPLDTGKNTATTVERIHKPIRVRIHRYCHRCETVFGPDRNCTKCDHRRCKKCPRYPIEKRTSDRPGARRDGSTQGRGKDRARSEIREPLLVIQSRAQILVHQPIVQRIQRSCHKCKTDFLPETAHLCTNCNHLRCARCPRSATKTDAWESRYPADAPRSDEENEMEEQPKKQERVFRRPRQRVRWNCDQCSALFLEGSKTCRGCGHAKCESCLRQPPKRNKEQFDPEIVNALHEKLSALVITTSSPE